MKKTRKKFGININNDLSLTDRSIKNGFYWDLLLNERSVKNMSPRTPKQYEEIREEKRTLIMDAALKHFATVGYHNTTISQIAKHAGISKGLMYNYFASKEELLSEIINRSTEEISRYFDPDRDGYLTEEEFELFIRKLFLILREKLSFWRLFYQFLMQKDVREKFLHSHIGNADSSKTLYTGRNSTFLIMMTKILNDYFVRKKEKMPAGYDPVLEMNMFLYTLEGFGMATVYQDEIDDNYYNKAINRIIELYK
jgi:AcrR family transcriptional regulator